MTYHAPTLTLVGAASTLVLGFSLQNQAKDGSTAICDRDPEMSLYRTEDESEW